MTHKSQNGYTIVPIKSKLIDSRNRSCVWTLSIKGEDEPDSNTKKRQ